MDDRVQHDGFGSGSALFKGVPFELGQHLGDTAEPAVVVRDKAGSSALDTFDFVLVGFGVGVPYGGGIFYDGADYGDIASFLDFGGTFAKVFL